MPNEKLDMFLRAITSGGGTLTPEMYQHFGGDKLVEALKQFDPGASVIQEDIGGGEAGSQGKGFRLSFDQTKLPTSKAGTAGLDLRPSNFGKLKNPNAVLDDDAYGSVTNSANVVKPKDPAWTHYAPMAIAALASLGTALPAAAAMEGAGAGAAAWGGSALADSSALGAAGGITSAATGSGLTGINTSGLPSYLLQAMGKAPQTVGQISDGNWNPLSLVPMLGQALGVDPNLAKGGLTLANLARAQRKP